MKERSGRRKLEEGGTLSQQWGQELLGTTEDCQTLPLPEAT